MGSQHRRNWQKGRKGKIRLWDESNARFSFEMATVEHEQLLSSCGLLPGSLGVPYRDEFPGVSIVVLQEWTEALSEVTGKSHPLNEVQDAVNDYLGKTPELGIDQSKVKLVCYFLKNYINPDPDFFDAKFTEKLTRAGSMALGFLAKVLDGGR